MTPHEQALLELVRECRELIAYYATEYEIGDEASELQHWPMAEVERCQKAVSLRDRIDAALSEHAAGQTTDSPSELGVETPSVSRSVPAAPASVSPQAPTALNLSCPFGEGVGQGGTAAGTDQGVAKLIENCTEAMNDTSAYTGADWVMVPSAEALRIANETLDDPDTRAQVKVKLVAAGLPLMADLVDEAVILSHEIIRLSAAPRPDAGEGLVEWFRDNACAYPGCGVTPETCRLVRCRNFAEAARALGRGEGKS